MSSGAVFQQPVRDLRVFKRFRDLCLAPCYRPLWGCTVDMQMHAVQGRIDAGST